MFGSWESDAANDVFLALLESLESPFARK